MLVRQINAKYGWEIRVGVVYLESTNKKCQVAKPCRDHSDVHRIDVGRLYCALYMHLTSTPHSYDVKTQIIT